MKKETNHLDRRGFIKESIGITAAAPIAVVIAQSALAKDKEIDPKELLPESNPIAKGLQYVHAVSDAKNRKAARMGVAANKQFCDNCQLYVPSGVLKGSKEKVGKCTMIPQGYVKAKGWCNSWVKKA